MSTAGEEPATPGLASADGRLVPVAEACVPILDRGFVRSDATRESGAGVGGAFPLSRLTGFNVFVVTDGMLATPERGVVEGITRRTVMDLAHDPQRRFEVRPVGAIEVGRADEIFTASTAGGVIPATRHEHQPVGDRRPGALTRRGPRTSVANTR